MAAIDGLAGPSMATRFPIDGLAGPVVVGYHLRRDRSLHVTTCAIRAQAVLWFHLITYNSMHEYLL